MNSVSNMSNVIVERTVKVPLLEKEDCRALAEIVACFNIHKVRFVESFLSEHHDRMICHFEAPDVESVRQAMRGAGLEIDSIWMAKVIRRHQHA
jgi:hypothetical protein